MPCRTVESRNPFHMFGNDVAEPFREGHDSHRNYLRLQMGPRLQLLQLRENKPHLSSEPILNTDGRNPSVDVVKTDSVSKFQRSDHL